jgi:Fe-Mn family superoxide dismutase
MSSLARASRRLIRTRNLEAPKSRTSLYSGLGLGFYTDPFMKSSLSSTTSAIEPYTLPSLPYDFGELEPVISAEIMKLHWDKHHRGYVTNLNIALEKYVEAEKRRDVATMIQLQSAIRFNGGGHVNHSIFWTNLASPKSGGGGKPTGELLKEIEKEWGSFENFVNKMNTVTGAIQGSGWGWLGYNKETKRLQIATCPNQDPLLAVHGLTPLLGLDVWEHAYYLQYKNARADYLKAIWNVVNWKNVADRFNEAKK